MSTALLLAFFFFGAPPPDPPASNVEGGAIYRSNCAFCHGLTGLGGRGPDLVTHPKPAADIRRVVKQGVPGSTMPAFDGFDEADLDRIAAFVRHLAGSAPAGETVTGDPAQGRQVYATLGCANCHLTGAEGSTYGPDLTRIGGARSAHYLRESITEPSADVPAEYEGVTVVTRDGKKVRGVRVNQDSFSVQLRLPSQQFRSFVVGKDAADIVPDKTSLMPAYRELSKADLENLIAWLTTLRGEAAGGTKNAEGIR